MSVQVKHRRESAAFLTTFVGAQGELIVDTTNNRIQVHDGATPGGFPAAKLSEIVSPAGFATNGANVNITSLTGLTTPLSVGQGGTGASTATAARTGLGAAASGANGDITSLSGLTTPLGLAQGGTGGTTAVAARAAFGAAGSGANADITSVAGLLTPLSGGINKFRNGTMDVWQRGTSALTVTTAGAYTADGWIALPSGASVVAQQGAGRLFTASSLSIQGSTGNTDVIVKQRIEGAVASPLSGQNVTIQAQIYNGTGATLIPTLTIRHANAVDNWTSFTTDTNAVSLQTCANGVWTQVAVTVLVSALAGKGVEVAFDFGALNAGGKTVQITELDIRATPGVPIGLNASPPAPELRPIGFELAFNQRYYNVLYGALFVAVGGTAPFGGAICALYFPSMRASPTAVLSSSGNSNWTGSVNSFTTNIQGGSNTLIVTSATTQSNSGAFNLFNAILTSEL